MWVEAVDEILAGEGPASAQVLGEELVARLDGEQAAPAVLQCIIDRASAPGGYRSAAELRRALALWRASVRPRPPEEARRRTPRAVAPIGWALIAVGAWSVVDHLENPRAAAAIVVPVDAHSAPLAEPSVVDGVAFDDASAARAVAWVNAAPPQSLADAGLPARARAAILAGRPFATVDQLGHLPGVGPATMRAVARAAAP